MTTVPSVGFIFTMQDRWSLEVIDSTDYFSFVDQGYLKCVVTNTQQPSEQCVLAFCLHCKALKSRSWFYKHKDAEGFHSSPEWARIVEERRQHFIEDIRTEVELMDEWGSFFVDVWPRRSKASV